MLDSGTSFASFLLNLPSVTKAWLGSLTTPKFTSILVSRFVIGNVYIWTIFWTKICDTNLVFQHTFLDLKPDQAIVYRKYLESTTRRIYSAIECIETLRIPYRLENSEESSMLGARFIEHTPSWSDTREYWYGQGLVKEEFRLPYIKKIHVNGLLLLWLDMFKLEHSWESHSSRKNRWSSHMF